MTEAFRRDDVAEVRRLLDRDPELHARINDPSGDFGSPLVNNVRSKAMLDVLIDAGADLNVRSNWAPGGFGMLETVSPEIALYAISRGATITVHGAARLGLVDDLRSLLAADPALVNARGGDGKMPLHYAATPEIAAFLLDHGADITARDIDHDSTAAQYAVKDRPDVCRYLIGQGSPADILMAAALNDRALAERILAADPDAIRTRVSSEWFQMTGDGARHGGTIYQWELGWYVSAVQVAIRFGHHELAAFLTSQSPADEQFLNACWLHTDLPERPSHFSPAAQRHLAHAARNNDLEAFRPLLEAGLPVDGQSQHHATPLHWAAFHGNAEMIRLLLAKGASLENTDNDYQGTPLNWAQHGAKGGWFKTGDYITSMKLLGG